MNTFKASAKSNVLPQTSVSTYQLAIWVAVSAVVTAPIWSLLSYATIFGFGLLLAMLITATFVESRCNFRLRPLLVSHFLMLIWVVASCNWAVDRQHSLTAAATLFGFMMIGAAFAASPIEMGIQDLIPSRVAVSAAGLALIGFAVAIGCIMLFGTLRPDAKRLHFLGSFDTRLASYMTATIPLNVHGILYGRHRTVSGLAVLAAILTGLLTQTRAGIALPIAAFGLTMFMLAFLNPRRVPRGIWWIGTAAILLASIGTAFLIETGLLQATVQRLQQINVEEFSQFDAPVKEDRSQTQDYGRKAMYATGWTVVQEYSVMGIGYNSLGFLVEERYGQYVMSHNVVITVLGELGLIGGVLFVCCLTGLAWDLNRAYQMRKSDSGGALLACLAMTIGLILALAMIRPQQGNPMLFVSAGAIHGIAYRSRRF